MESKKIGRGSKACRHQSAARVGSASGVLFQGLIVQAGMKSDIVHESLADGQVRMGLVRSGASTNQFNNMGGIIMIPSLFIAHGSPLLAVEQNEYTQFLGRLGRTLPRPQAVIVFSAHWVAGIQHVSDIDRYDTMYDFGGFPDALYQIRYPAKGDAKIAKQIETLLMDNDVPFVVETRRGLDHGAWIVLRLLFPEADIPVIAMSVNPDYPPEQQYVIGKSLQSLRQQDVLIIGSGGTVHNLGAVEWQETATNPWALEFDQWLADHLALWDLASLYRYDQLAPNASRAVPHQGAEHFVPIFYALGAADEARRAQLLHRSYRYGNLSHSVWQFG